MALNVDHFSILPTAPAVQLGPFRGKVLSMLTVTAMLETGENVPGAPALVGIAAGAGAVGGEPTGEAVGTVAVPGAPPVGVTTAPN